MTLVKTIIFTIFFAIFFIDCYSQKTAKPAINDTAYDRWPYLKDPAIAPDGKYITYAFYNASKKSDTVVLKKRKGSWEVKFANIYYSQFTSDSRRAVLIDTANTLYTILLGSAYFDRTLGVHYFKIPTNGNGEWLAFKHVGKEDMVLVNFITRREVIYSLVSNFCFSDDGRILLYVIGDPNCLGEQKIVWHNLEKRKEIIMWCGRRVESILINSFPSAAVFITTDEESGSKKIWLYKERSNMPVLLVDQNIFSSNREFVLDNILKISANGKYVFFTVTKEGMVDEGKSESSIVKIWSYQDPKLQLTQQVSDLHKDRFGTMVVDVDSRRVTCLRKDNEFILGSSADDAMHLVESIPEEADLEESIRNERFFSRFYTRSADGRINVLLKFKGPHIAAISPNGKYIVYFDNENAEYVSYEIASGKYRNITEGIKTSWYGYYFKDIGDKPRGIATWTKDDESVLIYDRFDIWMIDPKGIENPVNITSGFGKQNNIIFYLGLAEYSNREILRSQPLLLNAVSIDTKENGYYEKTLGKDVVPRKLTMGNYIYQLIDNPYVMRNGIYPLKARDKDAFIVVRMNATEYPNFFYTRDFINFYPISTLQPEKSFNWYTTELHSWKTEKGEDLQGVLYKPDDFDPKKKYPVIFHYYEKKSFELNDYLIPSNLSNGCNIDIPTYVSNGYLVFLPDINYVVGDPMTSTLSALTSAAKYVERLPYVNKSRMGIGGCSFGGIQTNYLVTHTGIFSAAYSSSSMSDFVSAYGSITRGGKSLQAYFEPGGQGRMGGTLWQAPDMYIRNSAIFNADKAITPLLLMHTTNDEICSFSQALELFMALRRLGKRVWLLEYTDGSHHIDGKSAVDFSIRLRQFFDHYLKGLPAPAWMGYLGQERN
ncbi:dipeptidyl aminopeptidase/acylaminoacyl peptidase [Chitinophaga polysaccharea]|uniref:Dipeptidyl aminopeptidase/acylaminoacyl peptidase n=1 Tax=Chitinophaga polysaccharea TaxID=1293035 RepID=A0A561PCB3_9BACT|nr:prolyl oligopeptidase family serine peptidase [Chitinophaga polysaccharea]TWF35767.1 dipeptidyl aminopeptidase/acylaminoacyl peptidase [Chitinophaga polysaccharea]